MLWRKKQAPAQKKQALITAQNVRQVAEEVRSYIEGIQDLLDQDTLESLHARGQEITRSWASTGLEQFAPPQ